MSAQKVRQKYHICMPTLRRVIIENGLVWRTWIKPDGAEQDQLITLDILNGLSIKKMKKKYKTSSCHISKLFKKTGVNRRPTNFRYRIDEDLAASVVKSYQDGKGIHQIKKELVVSIQSIYKVLKSNHVEIRPPHFNTWTEEKRQKRINLLKGKPFNSTKRDPNTPEYIIARNSKAFKQWRKAILERDGYSCTNCGKKQEDLELPLHTHHIKSFFIFKELRFDMNNGQTLCESCHRKTNNWGVSYKKDLEISEKTES